MLSRNKCIGGGRSTLDKMFKFENSFGYRTHVEDPITWNSQINDYSGNLTWNSIHSRSRRATNFLFSGKNQLQKRKLWDKAYNLLFDPLNREYLHLLENIRVENKVIDLFVEEVEKILIDWHIPSYKIKEIMYDVLSIEKEAILDYLGIIYERDYLDQKIHSNTYSFYNVSGHDSDYIEFKTLLEEIILPFSINIPLIETESFTYPIIRSAISDSYDEKIQSPGKGLVSAFIKILTGQTKVVEPEQPKDNNSVHSESNKDEFLEGITHCMQSRSSLEVVV